MLNLAENDKNILFDTIILMSEKIVEYAIGNDWKFVDDLENQRKEVIRKYVELIINLKSESDVLKIQELIRINKKLIYIAKKTRHEIREKIKNIHATKKVSGVYHEISNSY